MQSLLQVRTCTILYSTVLTVPIVFIVWPYNTAHFIVSEGMSNVPVLYTVFVPKRIVVIIIIIIIISKVTTDTEKNCSIDFFEISIL